MTLFFIWSCDYIINNYGEVRHAIGISAFEGCSLLEEVETATWSEYSLACGDQYYFDSNLSVKKIESCAFRDCKQLRTLSFDYHLQIIEPHAFDGCTSLRAVTIPDGVWELTCGERTKKIDSKKKSREQIASLLKEYSDYTWKKASENNKNNKGIWGIFKK